MSSTTANNHFVLVSEGEWADGVALFIGLPTKEAIESCDIVDHDAFNQALRGLSDLANEVMPVYEVAIHKYTLNPGDEDAEVFEDHDGRMDYEELTAWITQESWESSQCPLSVSGADHAWLSSYSYIDPYSGVETWFTLRIRESAEVNYHLYSLFLKGK